MLARKNSSKKGKSIPQDWLEGVSRLLNETYKDQIEDQKEYFDVYGQIYLDELLFIVSLISEEDPSTSPITLFLSCEPEQIETQEKVKETQKNFIDIVGLFFDEIFANEDWDEFEPIWQEVTYKNSKYFYKITRENIQLSLEANKLLGEDLTNEDEEIIH